MNFSVRPVGPSAARSPVSLLFAVVCAFLLLDGVLLVQANTEVVQEGNSTEIKLLGTLVHSRFRV